MSSSVNALASMIVQFPEITFSESVQSQVERAVEFMGTKATVCIPNVLLNQNGPFVRSVFVITESFLCEVDASSGSGEFDIVDKRVVANYRVRYLSIPIGESSPPTQHKGVTVILKHDFAEFNSQLTFIGERWEEWLKLVRKALPPSSVRRQRAKLTR